MSVPSSDRAAIRQTIRALKAADHQIVGVDDGDNEIVPTATEDATIAAIMAVDCAHLFVRLPVLTDVPGEEATQGWIFFVMGNSPEEVICDHTLNLSPVIDPLTGGWS